MECVSEDVSEQTCPLIIGCETRPVWLQMRDAIVKTLDSTTLGDLITSVATSFSPAIGRQPASSPQSSVDRVSIRLDSVLARRQAHTS